MSIRVRLLSGVVGVIVLGAVASRDAGGQTARPVIATEADFRRAMKERSNWDRWGEQDELEPGTAIHREDRYEFLFMAAPLRIEKGRGSPLNPLAVF